ncbi:MAG: succinate dehydrogenase cytochrome b subunit [Bacteroidota bacterium]|nr:succinate dehydrogenase cytochrome b subunit [Bacteroidota bacterium]
MGLTGLFLCLFLIVHLSGNLLLFSDDAGRGFNEYTLFMTTNILIRGAEIGLVAGFLAHIILAIMTTRKNQKARPIKYEVSRVNETASIYSRNMGVTGSIILIFLILHLKTFWFTYQYGEIPVQTYEDGVQLKNMYLVVQEAFSQWWYSGIYVIAMILLGAHLNHGFQSAFRSLGLNNKSYAPVLTIIGSAFAITITIGFASFPILFFFGFVGV